MYGTLYRELIQEDKLKQNVHFVMHQETSFSKVDEFMSIRQHEGHVAEIPGVRLAYKYGVCLVL